MTMFRTCQAKLVRVDPKICGSRSTADRLVKCNGHCAGCFGKCRNIRTAGHDVCKIDSNYVYAHVSGLHGTQKCSDGGHPGIGQLRGNSNGDFFWWKRTLLAWKPDLQMHAFETWRGKDNLENHDETRIIGDIPDVWPDMRTRSVDMLVRTSSRRAWNITESIRKGSITDVSMGTLVNHSFCSICNNRAETEEQWCDHLKHVKGQFLDRSELSREDQTKFPEGKWCYEDNRDIYGIELSWITVGEGADPDAKVKNLIAGFDGPQGKQFSRNSNKKISMVDAYWSKYGRNI